MLYLRPLAVLLFSIGIAACGTGFDEKTGGDGNRGEAIEIALDTMLHDRVSAGEGDNTDWKKFELEDAAKLTISMWWDQAGASATVTLRDEMGKTLTTLKHDKNARAEKLGPLSAKAGVYYLQVEAKGGTSVYTYEVKTSEGGGAGGGDEMTPF